ncbi:uncharacterized protein TrAFT101_002681 [Trichoderma asperellum]|uniref:F-box domain-containing protein n=1 Tax=Trichoderma asperellum (strain ATCC 204424 / CBS 433.97 / NBRC 101777) TaxID=1042311 RepID=A0A2T3ZH42_TRIA4|nr:hypothetical protein M441DRAFT_341984 [Trichoderma asperellum CBS 433.97]PTB44127.1 hypothetical protein M441DRAFT_341984 [Trichoderma asperellum CBS 433.97]UKZ86857.1 hypothetical protein TrAFT101_002681 [Trichoderma asperellum]
MNMASLGSLPGDLILDIAQHLDAARDVAHLGAVSKHAHTVINQSGWRSFVRSKFPSIDVAPGALMGWNAVADRLTYLDRCWDSRGITFTVYGEKSPARPKRREFARSRQSVNFHSVMDATTILSTQEEMLVYGAGENLVLRRKDTSGRGQDSWSKLAGRETGYAAGTGDVTAISIIQRQQFPEVVVGRATGDLQLLSARDEILTDASQTFPPTHDTNNESKAPLTRRSPGQRAVSWTEWQPDSQLLASCRSSVLTLYNLSDTEEATLKPVLFYDVSKDSAADEISLLRSVKFMSQDVVACGLGGCSDPLRWAKIRPTGIEMLNVAKEGAVGDSTERLAEKTTVRSMQPVPKMNENLLLSAWDDGSHRLSDLRSPLGHDVLYRDGFQPYQASSSMLVYGSERFVAGNNCSPDIRFFDFRFPKSYYHTNAMPCSVDVPTPGRPYQFGDIIETNGLQIQSTDTCNPSCGQTCTWHHLSKQDSWRPDAVIHIYSASMDRVHCLAKASDLSTSFYCGVRGALVEATYALGEDVYSGAAVSRRSAPDGWQASDPEGRVSLMETGVGLRDGESQLEEQTQTRMPELYYYERWRIPEAGSEEAEPLKREEGRRLDPALVASRRGRS